jgi:hypothetical protein
LKDLSANYCYQTDENGERETVFSANAQERTPHLCPHVSPYMSRRELLFSDASASAASQTESMQFIDAENCFYLIPLQTGVQTIGLTPGIVTIGSSNECNIKVWSSYIKHFTIIKI